MTTTTQPTGRGTATKLSRTSAWIAFSIAVLITLQGAVLLFLGFDETNFAEAAGIVWEQFEADNHNVAAYLNQGSADRIFAVTALGLGFQTALLLILSIRQKLSAARHLLFTLPAVLVGWSLILIPANQNSIAIPSAAFGVLMALAIALASRTLRQHRNAQ